MEKNTKKLNLLAKWHFCGSVFHNMSNYSALHVLRLHDWRTTATNWVLMLTAKRLTIHESFTFLCMGNVKSECFFEESWETDSDHVQLKLCKSLTLSDCVIQLLPCLFISTLTLSLRWPISTKVFIDTTCISSDDVTSVRKQAKIAMLAVDITNWCNCLQILGRTTFGGGIYTTLIMLWFYNTFKFFQYSEG